MKPITILRSAGFRHSWRRVAPGLVRVTLWRADAEAGERHHVACAFAPDDRAAIRARALALFSFALAVPVPPGAPAKTAAVLMGLGITARRMAERELRRARHEPARRLEAA